jgi:hypothetical protein
VSSKLKAQSEKKGKGVPLSGDTYHEEDLHQFIEPCCFIFDSGMERTVEELCKP